MTTAISIHILAIVALGFTIWLARRNPIVNNYKNRIYIWLSVLVILILLLEIATVIMDYYPGSKWVTANRIANIFGFALSPAVAFLFMYFNNSNTKQPLNKLLFIPLIVNSFICILSYSTGWIFFIDAQNHYSRGDLFALPTLTGLFYFLLAIAAVVKNDVAYEIDDKNILLVVLSIPVAGILMQILYKDLLLIWGSIAVCLLLYYIFLRELQFKYDVQTGIKNRAAFQKQIDQYAREKTKAVIVILDINNLKRINDVYGHKIGDEAIYTAANLIVDSFAGIGEVFRMGGDEFCAICLDASPESIDRVLTKLENSLSDVNKESTYHIVLAYGYAVCDHQGGNIYKTFEQADKNMYQHKATLKQEPSYFVIKGETL